MMPCRGAAGAQESCRAMPPEEELPARYGSRFFVEGVPEAEFPDRTFTLNFSTGSAVMLGQYYNICRFGREGYREIIGAMKKNADFLAGGWRSRGAGSWSAAMSRSCRWSAGSSPARRSSATTSSTSPRCWPPSAAG
jgi:hypothetical protein